MTNEEAVLAHAKENLQRKNLNWIEEGREYDNMLKKLSEIRGKKVTQEELAKNLTGAEKKRSQENISNKIPLLKMSKPVQNYLALNKLGIYNALLLLQIKDDARAVLNKTKHLPIRGNGGSAMTEVASG